MLALPATPSMLSCSAWRLESIVSWAAVRTRSTKREPGVESSPPMPVGAWPGVTPSGLPTEALR
jgi:hypothetical protein